jgi:flagellar assembly factor FliW
VLVIVSQVNGNLTVNLKAPLVIHLDERLGRQIVARDDHAVQFSVDTRIPLRKSA